MQVALNQKAAEAGDNRCHHCARPITLDKAQWLEMDTRTGMLHIAEAPIPPEYSQGMFPIGASCWNRLLREASA